MHCQVGIGEFGTATNRGEGWAVVSLADAEAAVLAARAPALLGGRIAKFHGIEFTREAAAQYRDFLELLKDCCRAGPGAFIACSLNHEAWRAEFTAFADRVLADTLLAAGVPLDEARRAALREVVPPLFTYLRVASQVGGECTASIVLDKCDATADFNEATVAVYGHPYSLAHLAGVLYRAYRRQRFQRSPQVTRDAVRVCSDDDSFLVQAADVVGNFATAYIFSRLRKKTQAGDLKASIFRDVFADCGIDDFDHAAKFEVSGHDLRLKHSGAHTFFVS